ncbi:glycosyltransferase family 4 protein [Microbacterium sediminis]|uniref:Glycosyltransferase n=1 Tax=Microbacterium sediminis TaxID=904291 RepID=A0A1B9NCN6_9MICO|nr:glycosyltransferase family 4 protein [Microbacterium sediminis]OCG74360.1 glycosyltransferase [Microbacterium sediminis]QBR73728.1 glycosyltransferase family 4 protein [Microbacterium sediminis]
MSFTTPSAITAPAPGADASPRTPLRIGMVAPPWFALPPAGYGGTEAVVAGLVDALVARGHEVVLVGAGTNGTRAQEFHAAYDAPPTARLGEPVPEAIAAAFARRALEEAGVDIVHDNTLCGPLLAGGRAAPTVVTMHGPVAGENGRYHELLGRSVSVVAISDAQRRANPRINWCGTVHNAIDVASFPLRERKDDLLLWIGRFSPDKAPHLAIDAARAAGRRIVLAGKLNERAEHAYFDAEVRPRLGRDAEYVGEADAALKRELFAAARALVFPIQWEEPFGMVMVEAMACGTPVVATRRGSVPEVVAHGHTGVVVDPDAGPRELAAAIAAAEELDPRECRRHAEQRFDLAVMAEGYERVYRSLLEPVELYEDEDRDAAGLVAA